MRPLRLDLAGFTVFREPVTIDFTDADFFALVGPTGSGKSTVLDAICFALYGTVPRWGDRRAIANALAPSATEARVRMVFESAGARYVLARVVRRDGKGGVSTKHAGLEALPPGFDLASFDTGLSESDLGEVLAGTPSEVDAAVADVVGLPYEQFTKCVVLPQGEFAAFLHAKPSERQRILVNLLGLEVYGRVRERANALAAGCEGQVAAADQLLSTLTDATDEAVAAAEHRAEAMRTLVSEVDRLLPELTTAQQASAEAARALAALDTEIARLVGVHAPADAASAAAEASAASAVVADAAAAVSAAEEREEKLRAEFAAAGDAVALRRLLDGYADADRLAEESRSHAEVVTAAERAHASAVEALGRAQATAAAAHADLERAREAYQEAVAADRAAALRPHLRVGQPCPVCEQPVATVPAGTHRPVVAEAEAAGTAARRAADTADAAVAKHDRLSRERELALARARERASQLAGRLTELRERLAEAPNQDTVRQRLAAITALERDLVNASERVRTARAAQRRAAADATAAEERLRTAWRVFDATRDGLAPLGPPAVDRDDLGAAWAALVAWASGEAAERDRARAAAAEAVAAAERAEDHIHERAAALFDDSGVAAPGGARASTGGRVAGAALQRAAAVALERAEADHRRCCERRADAERMRAQRTEHERTARVARTLASHLRADRFERWLLTEALDSLVGGASRILRELSSGQYDLGHDKGEFFVIDHHDAGLRRAVRTLSGGETFQASLALALALSEQLAGASTATASLESILLDEGFGTLDASTLDSVTATLENLAARGDRMVGVVTHVTALAERIPVRFEVRRDARSARVERLGS